MTQSIVNWFAGGDEHPYHTLWHCMSRDTLWVAITVGLDLVVALGYCLIALHWWKNQRQLENPQAGVALGRMRNIFIFCGICGYVFIPIKMMWPAWRFYDMFLVVLAYFTWRYAWGARDLRVIYAELNRTNQLSRELAASRAESRRKSLFLNAVSHDLRNPLFGASLFLTTARGCVAKDPERASAALAEAESGLAQAAKLLDKFLSFARIDTNGTANAVAPIDLSRLVRELSVPAGESAGRKGLALHLQLEDATLRSDESKVRRILENLLDNAIKYTQAGEVTVAVRPTTAARGGAAGAILEVVDTGVGIDAAALDRIFEDFYQVHNEERDSRKGIGLGLPIVRRLVDQLQGSIHVASAPGKGSAFRVELQHLA